jgi:hypothetical protein
MGLRRGARFGRWTGSGQRRSVWHACASGRRTDSALLSFARLLRQLAERREEDRRAKRSCWRPLPGLRAPLRVGPTALCQPAFVDAGAGPPALVPLPIGREIDGAFTRSTRPVLAPGGDRMPLGVIGRPTGRKPGGIDSVCSVRNKTDPACRNAAGSGVPPPAIWEGCWPLPRCGSRHGNRPSLLLQKGEKRAAARFSPRISGLRSKNGARARPLPRSIASKRPAVQSK